MPENCVSLCAKLRHQIHSLHSSRGSYCSKIFTLAEKVTTNSNCLSLWRGNSIMNAERKHFAATTSLSHCKETTPGASTSFATEGKVCLAELPQSRLPGNLHGMQKIQLWKEPGSLALAPLVCLAPPKPNIQHPDDRAQETGGASAAKTAEVPRWPGWVWTLPWRYSKALSNVLQGTLPQQGGWSRWSFPTLPILGYPARGQVESSSASTSVTRVLFKPICNYIFL